MLEKRNWKVYGRFFPCDTTMKLRIGQVEAYCVARPTVDKMLLFCFFQYLNSVKSLYDITQFHTNTYHTFGLNKDHFKAKEKGLSTVKM